MVTLKMAQPREESPAAAAPGAPPAQVEDQQSVEESGVGSLTAAAQFLSEKFADSAPLLNEVKSAAETDALVATRSLATMFVSALDCEEISAETGSFEGCMQELLLWIKRECKMDEALVLKFGNDLCQGTSRGELRLKCMGLLYNAINENNSTVRYQLLNKIIELATKVKRVPLLHKTVLPQVDKFLLQWKTPAAEKKTTYKNCYEALKSIGDIEGAFNFNVKMLEICTPGSEYDATIDAIVQAVRLPKLYRFDTLLELAVIKAFKNDSNATNSLLYKLINIFVQEDLESFMKFYSENTKFLEKLEINKDIAIDKMRLLTFASLGIESQDLAYDVIAKALQIPEDLVEEWVIRAISSGLVDAKVNQLKSSVAIYRSTQRMFTREEWQPLSERINIWKENISDLLAGLREMKQGGGHINLDQGVNTLMG